MAVTDGKMKFSIIGSDVEVSVPSYGYKTTIAYPWDIANLSKGQVAVYDNGAEYDKRKCNCLVYMTSDEIAWFNRYINFNSNDSKAANLTLELNSNSGFFPFGADKGGRGDFTVALTIKKHGRVGDEPFRYFVVEIEMHNVGMWPQYTLPQNKREGNFTFGDVAECRFPSDWFNPKVKYSNYLVIDQGSHSNWIDRGSEGDSYLASFDFNFDIPKASRIIKYITDDIRTGLFVVVPPANSYMFGRDQVNTHGFVVQIATNQLEIVHVRKSMFTMGMKLSYLRDNVG